MNPSAKSAQIARPMPLITLNRINKGGEIMINTDHILFAEVESRTTTVHLTNSMLFSVEESLAALKAKVDAAGADRIRDI